MYYTNVLLKFIKKVKNFCFLQDQAFCKQKVYLLGCITTPIEYTHVITIIFNFSTKILFSIINFTAFNTVAIAIATAVVAIVTVLVVVVVIIYHKIEYYFHVE